MSAVAAGRGAAFWQSLVRPGRAVYFPNIDLRLVPPNAETNAHETGMDVVTFITKPAVTKVDVKETLEKVYGIGVSRVHTVNYEGKKKRRGNYFYHRPDYKKVYVQLRERWYPPKGFAVTALDGDVDKGHKVKKSPVKKPPICAKMSWSPSLSKSANATPCPFCRCPTPLANVTSSNRRAVALPPPLPLLLSLSPPAARTLWVRVLGCSVRRSGLPVPR